MGDAITRGIVNFARQRSRWSFTTSAEGITLPITALHGWDGDGIVASVTTPDESAAAGKLQRAGIPVVTFSDVLPAMTIPGVQIDDAAVGRLAADHLVRCGYRQFGFYGLRGVAYSEARLIAFRQQLGQGATLPCAVQLAQNGYNGPQHADAEIHLLASWLRKCRGSLGLFAANDVRASIAARACEAAGLRIPEDVGILGAGNNQIICESCNPTLSSVSWDWRYLGFQLAQLLDRLMTRAVVSAERQRLSPLEVVTRTSTQVRTLGDQRIERAIDFVRNNFSGEIEIPALARIAGLSRRRLEGLFRLTVGCPPYQFICKARVDHSKILLSADDRMKFSEISARCGFADVRRFHMVFRRVEGVSPVAYRRSLKKR